MKRAFDVVVGTVLALAALPVMVALAVGAAIALRAWPLFVQQRIGLNGRLFHFVKIRTLPMSVGRYVDKYQLDLDSIPRFTRWLRRTHLDELPQLFLVPIGKMSLVGPRPEMSELHSSMSESFAAERTSMRPGCTGLWQISDHCDGLIAEAPAYDRFYFEHASLRLNIWVIVRTIRMVLLGGRTITLDDVPAWAYANRGVESTDFALEGAID
jgi:lipopolysaccharide/colanic/teichoic acid biosynthesis glycosyltransferase